MTTGAAIFHDFRHIIISYNNSHTPANNHYLWQLAVGLFNIITIIIIIVVDYYYFFVYIKITPLANVVLLLIRNH